MTEQVYVEELLALASISISAVSRGNESRVVIRANVPWADSPIDRVYLVNRADPVKALETIVKEMLYGPELAR